MTRAGGASDGGAEGGDYWYCLVHQTVEHRSGCANKDRIGPFATAEEASRALATIADRQARYDAEDEADRDS